MDLSQLTSKGRAPNLERQTPASLDHMLVDVGDIAPIGPIVVVVASLDDDARLPSARLSGHVVALDVL